MSDAGSKPAEVGAARGTFGELLAEGRAPYTIMIVGGMALHATQILVIAIIMPTVVADIGGAAYYTWAAMLYVIGSIVGAASTSVVWANLGARNGFALAAAVFALATAVCALAPNMGVLIAARGFQGWAGGLVAGGGTALVASLFDVRLRTRILAVSQATFTACHLTGPVVGGMFAAINWWRGSFWLMVPVMVAFAVVARIKIPDRLGTAEQGKPIPFVRLGALAAGACAVAAAAPIEHAVLRAVMIAAGISLVVLTFRLDRTLGNKLFPRRALSLNAPIGLALWILALQAMCQTSVTLFTPLLLQVVHGVSPLIINFVTIVISSGWTFGAFWVSGWSGGRERLALLSGPILSFIGLACIALVAVMPGLVLLTVCAFIMGLGLGFYNVHLVARSIEGADKDEQRTTASALVSVRSIGTAFGAASAGVIAQAAGLGSATDPEAVGRAVTTVYAACLVPLALAAVLMFRFVSFGPPTPKQST